jgi:glycosyltransferase involved in cell wall biosynthesis
MKAPLISVIVPVYNVELYLRKCLDSVLEQTFKDFELICINDASTDHSINILQEYSTRDARINIIDLNENQGLGGARNEGIKQARSEFVLFVDSDDWIAPTTLEKVFACAQENNADIVNFDYYCYNSELNIEPRHSIQYATIADSAEILRNKVLCQAGTTAWQNLYKKSLFTTLECYFPTKKYHEDFIILIIFCHAKNIYRVDSPLYYYRNNNYSITRSKNDFRIFEALEVAALMYKSMKELGFYTEYSIEIDYAFYQLFYRRPILHCFNRFDHIPSNKVVEIKKEFPKYLTWNKLKKNPYYKHRNVDLKECFLMLVTMNHPLSIFMYKIVVHANQFLFRKKFSSAKYLDKESISL